MTNRDAPAHGDMRESGRQQDPQAQSKPAAGPGSAQEKEQRNGQPSTADDSGQRGGTTSTPSPNQSGSMGSTRRDDTSAPGSGAKR